MLCGEVLAVVPPCQQDVVVVHRLEGQVRRVAVGSVRDDPFRLVGGLGPLDDRAERHALPGVVQRGPARDAVHVRIDRHPRQVQQLLVGQRERLFDQTGDLQVPVLAVEPWGSIRSAAPATTSRDADPAARARRSQAGNSS